MARRRNVAHPRRYTDSRGIVAKARGRAEDWDHGTGVVAPLDVESCLTRLSMDLEAWTVHGTVAAFWSAGHTEIRLSALARSAGVPKRAVERALLRAGGLPLAQATDVSAVRLPKRVSFVYEHGHDGIVRLHRALEAWRNQGVYVLLPIHVIRAAPSAPAVRLLIAIGGVAVRRDENAARNWRRKDIRKLLALPPAADVDATLAEALPWVGEHLPKDRRVVIEPDDGWLRVAAGPAEHTVERLLEDGFDPLLHQARYARRDVLRSLTVFDGPADGKRMTLPGLWLHRAADHLSRFPAAVTAEQLRAQWLVFVHAAHQGMGTPLDVGADLSGSLRATFSAFVGAVARLAADGRAWCLGKADVEAAEATRLRRWLLRGGAAARQTGCMPGPTTAG